MAHRDFITRIEALLRVNMPVDMAAAYEVETMAEHCVKVAKSYTLITERAIAAFVLHMININPEFHKQPSINAVLKREGLDDFSKMELLLSDTTESDWAEAAAVCDKGEYWEPFLANVVVAPAG